MVFGNPFTVTTNGACDRFREYRKLLLLLTKSFGTQISGIFSVLRIEEGTSTIRKTSYVSVINTGTDRIQGLDDLQQRLGWFLFDNVNKSN